MVIIYLFGIKRPHVQLLLYIYTHRRKQCRKSTTREVQVWNIYKRKTHILRSFRCVMHIIISIILCGMHPISLFLACFAAVLLILTILIFFLSIDWSKWSIFFSSVNGKRENGPSNGLRLRVRTRDCRLLNLIVRRVSSMPKRICCIYVINMKYIKIGQINFASSFSLSLFLASVISMMVHFCIKYKQNHLNAPIYLVLMADESEKKILSYRKGRLATLIRASPVKPKSKSAVQPKKMMEKSRQIEGVSVRTNSSNNNI